MYVLHTTVQCYHFERLVLISGQHSHYFSNSPRITDYRNPHKISPTLTTFLIGHFGVEYKKIFFSNWAFLRWVFFKNVPILCCVMLIHSKNRAIGIPRKVTKFRWRAASVRKNNDSRTTEGGGGCEQACNKYEISGTAEESIVDNFWYFLNFDEKVGETMGTECGPRSIGTVPHRW